jgi:hypothetical protein
MRLLKDSRAVGCPCPESPPSRLPRARRRRMPPALPRVVAWTSASRSDAAARSHEALVIEGDSPAFKLDLIFSSCKITYGRYGALACGEWWCYVNVSIPHLACIFSRSPYSFLLWKHNLQDQWFSNGSLCWLFPWFHRPEWKIKERDS